MDPCTDPRHRQTWAHMPKARKRHAGTMLTAALVILAAVLVAATLTKAIANVAHMQAQATAVSLFMEGY